MHNTFKGLDSTKLANSIELAERAVSLGKHAAEAHLRDGVDLNEYLSEKLPELGELPDYIVKQAVAEANNSTFAGMYATTHNVENVDFELADINKLHMGSDQMISEPEVKLAKRVDLRDRDYDSPPITKQASFDSAMFFGVKPTPVAKTKVQLLPLRDKLASIQGTIEAEMYSAKTASVMSAKAFADEVHKLASEGVSREELEYAIGTVYGETGLADRLDAATSSNMHNHSDVLLTKKASYNLNGIEVETEHPLLAAYGSLVGSALKLQDMTEKLASVTAELKALDARYIAGVTNAT